MSTKYKFHNQYSLYFITFAVVGWIDLFIRNEYREVLFDSWRYCIKNKGMQIYGWCIMTSHVHMIIGTEKDEAGFVTAPEKLLIQQRPRLLWAGIFVSAYYIA